MQVLLAYEPKDQVIRSVSVLNGIDVCRGDWEIVLPQRNDAGVSGFVV